MKDAPTIALAYISLFLWLWLAVELNETELKESIRSAPTFGFLISAWVVYRLEKKKKKENQTFSSFGWIAQIFVVLFFGALTYGSLSRAYTAISTTSASGEAYGVLVGKEISMVLLISVLSLIVVSSVIRLTHYPSKKAEPAGIVNDGAAPRRD